MLNTKALARHVSYFEIIRFKYYLVDKFLHRELWKPILLDTNALSSTALSIVSLRDHSVNAPHSY